MDNNVFLWQFPKTTDETPCRYFGNPRDGHYLQLLLSEPASIVGPKNQEEILLLDLNSFIFVTSDSNVL